MATRTQKVGTTQEKYGMVDPKTGKPAVLGTTTYGAIDPKTGQQKQTYTPATKTVVTYGEQQKAGQTASGAQSERTREGVFQNKTTGKYYDSNGREVNYNGASVAPVSSVKTIVPSPATPSSGYQSQGISKDQIANNPPPAGKQYALQSDGTYKLFDIPGAAQQIGTSPTPSVQAQGQQYGAGSTTTPAPQVPTASNPLMTLGETPTDNSGMSSYGRPFGELSDREKMIELQFRIAKGKSEFSKFSDEELKFLIGQQSPETPAAGADGGQVAQDIITGREDQLKNRELTLEEQRAELVRKKQAELDAEFERSKGLMTQGAERQKDASQTRFSFSGFGRSNKNDEALGLIEQSLNEDIMIADQKRSAALALFEAQQREADESTLQSLRDSIDTLKLQEDQAKIERANKIADLNAENKVSGLDAINNLITGLGLTADTPASTFDKDLTELINDGYLYKTSSSGVPMRVTDANGRDIATGVNESAESDLQYVPPLQNPLTGSLITPAYAFDKNSGMMFQVGQDGQPQQIPGGSQQAITNYKNFSEYTKAIGNGTVVKGSPYHTGTQVDIDGKIGDLIPSFVTGTVKNVISSKDDKSGFGTHVVVEDAQGNQFLYGHLNGASVGVGQKIMAGQPIGTMGNTGQVIKSAGGDGSHLHIQVKDKSGKLISLDSIVPEQTWQQSQFGTGNDDWLASEAISKGYAKPDEIQAYILSKKQGINLPDKASAEAEKLAEEKVQNEFNNVTSLITKYKPLNDEVSTLQQGFSAIQDYDVNHKNPSTDQALIFSFMKVLDPASVVREKEYATAQNNASMLDTLAANWKKAIDGEGILTVKQRQNIISEMQRLYKNKVTLYQQQIDQAKKVGSTYGLDPSLYIIPFEPISEPKKSTTQSNFDKYFANQK